MIKLGQLLTEILQEKACWNGYTQKGMKKKGDKMVPNCVPVKEDMTRINQNGQTYSVILMWRGRTYTFQMFIPTMRRPSKQDVEREVKKVYPDARVLTFMPKQYDPTDPTIIIPEAYDSRNPKDMGNPDNSLRRAVKKLGGNPKDVLPSKLPLANSYEPEDEMIESAAWTRKEGKNKEGGLNEKGRKSYERENPGSDLKAPSKKVGNKRRASFCARMSGMKKKLTSAKTANDPNSRINKSLRAWNC